MLERVAPRGGSRVDVSQTDERYVATSPHYQFVLDKAASYAASPDAAILDFGCGRGQIVALGRARGLNIFGVDTFSGPFHVLREQLPDACSGRILRVGEGVLPFRDESFAVVIANQVFEHIPDPRPALAEIARVLKPGGVLLALYPDKTTWYEGHVGLMFAHWLNSAPALQRAYLGGAHRLGLGYHRGGASPQAWAQRMQAALHQDVFFHDRRAADRWFESALGGKPKSLARDYIIARLKSSPRYARFAPHARTRAAQPVLETLCSVRAGRVLAIEKRPR